LEAESLVEGAGGVEVVGGAGFEVEAPVAAVAGLFDEVGEQGGGDAAALGAGGRTHGFDFGVVGVEVFEGGAAEEVVAVVGGPEGDVGVAQGVEVEGVFAFGWGDGAHLVDVFAEQGLDGGSGEVVDGDAQRHGDHCTVVG
jgi:hypothetical protein